MQDSQISTGSNKQKVREILDETKNYVLKTTLAENTLSFNLKIFDIYEETASYYVMQIKNETLSD